MTVKAEQLVSIPAFARAQKVHRVTAFRQLTQLHAADRAAGRGGWLVVSGPRRKLRLNVSFLKREHPGLFMHEFVRRGEHEELTARVATIESSQVHEKKRLNAVAASVRDVRGEIHRLQTVASGCGK
jgi:hypothetical protein